MTELLVVDDDGPLRRWYCRVLEDQGYLCTQAADAASARAALSESSFDLALLDVGLPGESGIELLSDIRIEHCRIGVLMVTGEDDLSLATTAIELGAYGYLVKPVRAGELVINVVNALHRRRTEAHTLRRLERLESSHAELEDALRRAFELGDVPSDVATAFQSDTVRRLVRMAEFRDDQTGQHLIRMSRYCEVIGLQLGFSDAWCGQLRLASELHDVGKVAIPDHILLKPGKLTSDEREVMNTHAEIGHRLLSDSESELMRTAARTALSHHERWDGGGYPRRLAGDAIPVEGRIAAVADVFDALTSDRVYRPAFPVGLAIEMMESERGRHFEPRMLDALLGAFERIDSVRRANSD
jgi:putative two-component system response regulator